MNPRHPFTRVTQHTMDRTSYDKRYRADYAGRVTYINVAFPNDVIAKLAARADRDGIRIAPLVRELALAQLEQMAFVSPAVEGKLDQLRHVRRQFHLQTSSPRWPG